MQTLVSVSLTLYSNNKYYRWFGYKGELSGVLVYLASHGISGQLIKEESLFVHKGVFKHGEVSGTWEAMGLPV